MFKAAKMFAQDIKIAHSVFALPFAACGFLLSFKPELLSFSLILKLIGAMICARSFAMGFNRWLDRHIDKKNPRTQQRKIPTGDITAGEHLSFSLLFGCLFIFIAFSIQHEITHSQAGWFSPPLLLILGFYSQTKHISWLCHWYLGLCIGLAPMAVGIVFGNISISLILLTLAVMFWTAGFDLLYAVQDLDFDRREGLQSFPSRFGIPVTRWTSQACFMVMVTCLAIIGIIEPLHWIYHLGVFLVAVCLFIEHWIIRGDQIHTHLNQAFFQMNAIISLVYYGFFQLAFWIRV